MPVATKEATGIDSRDEGVPLPLNLNPQPILKIKREAAAQRRPKKEKHFSTPKRTMPGGFHNHDVPPGDGDAGLVPRVSVPRHPPE